MKGHISSVRLPTMIEISFPLTFQHQKCPNHHARGIPSSRFMDCERCYSTHHKTNVRFLPKNPAYKLTFPLGMPNLVENLSIFVG